MKDLKCRSENVIKLLTPLWRDARREIGLTGDIDFEQCTALYEMGLLHVIVDSTLRPKCYAIWIDNPCVFTSEEQACVLSIYIKPEYRGTRLFYKLVKAIKESAMKYGFDYITFHIPTKMSTHKVFEKLCGPAQEKMYRLDLEY